MKHGWLSFVFSGSLFMMAGVAAHGQGPGGGRSPGGPPGGRGPGGPPGVGGPGGAGGPASNSGASAASSPAVRSSVRTANGIKLGPPGRWWDDHAVSATIGLRKDQQKKMDAIFDASKPAIISTYQTFQKEQTNLNAVSSASQVDKAKMFAAIDAVNQARAALQKATTDMLLQVRQQLDAEQIGKLEKLP